MRANPYAAGVHLDTAEPSKRIGIGFDWARHRAWSRRITESVAQALATAINGATLTHVREYNQLTAVVVRGQPAGSATPWSCWEEDPGCPRVARYLRWRRSRCGQTDSRTVFVATGSTPTISVRCADIYADRQSPGGRRTGAGNRWHRGRSCPPGYRMRDRGTVEESGKGQASVTVGMPCSYSRHHGTDGSARRAFAELMVVPPAPRRHRRCRTRPSRSGSRSVSWRCPAPSRCSAW